MRPVRDLRALGELKDLQPALKERLALGHWTAIHLLGSSTHRVGPGLSVARGGSRSIESVPKGAAWGYPDWTCLHPSEPRPLIIELKSERGKLESWQAGWLGLWHTSGAEVAVVRPRDVFVSNDPLTARLLKHKRCADSCDGLTGCTGWCRARDEALEAIAGQAPYHYDDFDEALGVYRVGALNAE